jgi:hypothetical protein
MRGDHSRALERVLRLAPSQDQAVNYRPQRAKDQVRRSTFTIARFENAKGVYAVYA